MPPKRKGPLQLAQGEVDELKKLVDTLVKDVQNKSKPVQDGPARCQDLQGKATKTQNTLKKLTKSGELAPVVNYDQKKREEQKRLQSIMERLNKLSLQLSPAGPSTTTAGNVSKKGTKKVSVEDMGNNSGRDEDDDEEDDDDDDDDGIKKQAMRSPSPSNRQIYTVLSDFKEEEEGDLSVWRGEELQIIQKAADGWWLAQNTKGNRGVVPKTFLKISSGVDDEDDDDEDEESEEDDQEKKSTSHSNWSSVRKALHEIDATDVLSAMGAIPSGFRPSTLNKLLVEEGVAYRGSHYIQPELSQSQLSFKDLFLDADTGRVRARQVKTCICFTLWSCRRIPTPGVGVHVLSRHIRLCAFDGTQVLSNIHTVRATYYPKSPKTWNFSPRVTGILPTLLDGDCFLRCNSSAPNFGILFELGITFIRNSTGERGDLSCGWAFLKLTDDAGNPLPNRTFDLPVYSGTPYEEDTAVETTINKGSPGGVLQQMLQARREPKLIVKVKSANSRTRAQLSLLPDTLLHCLGCVHLLAAHRQLLVDTLLMDRLNMQNADLVCSPVLSTFPLLLEQTDLLDALRSVWLDAESNMSRAQKKDFAFLKQDFARIYMSSVYFLLHSASLPPHLWADPASEEQRARVIYATLEALKDRQQPASQSGGLGVFLEPTRSHLAFDTSELTFDLLNIKR